MSIDDELKQSREERLDRLKKDMKDRPSGRPMGYIYPKKIQQILHGDNPLVKVGWLPGLDGTKTKKREVGERWVDENGKEWEQKEGYTISVPKYIEDIRMPESCPKCGKSMYDKEFRLNEKFYWIRKHCFDCQLREEQKIRLLGPDAWSKYEQSIMIKNIISYLQEGKKEILEYLPQLSDTTTYVTSEGKLEEWKGDSSKVKEFLEKELATIEDDLIHLEKDLQELESGFKTVS